MCWRSLRVESMGRANPLYQAYVSTFLLEGMPIYDLFRCLVHAIYTQGISANNIAVFLFQCFVTGLVYVQSRDQFCYYRAKSSGKSSQVCKSIFYFTLVYVKLVYELYSQSYLDYLSHNTSCFPQFQRTINRTDRYKYSVHTHTYTHTIYLDYLTIQIELIVFF